MQTFRLAGLLLLGLLAAVTAAGMANAAVTTATIVSVGPVELVAIGVDQACQLHYANDEQDSFYPGPAVRPGDCGTFVSVDGLLYGPDFGNHDGSAAAGSFPTMLDLTPVSQGAVSGTGTPADPFLVTTVTEAGGVAIAQTDSYVAGTDAYDTRYTITSADSGQHAVRLYHAGDCNILGPTGYFDRTYGWLPADGAGCSFSPGNSPSGRYIAFRSDVPANRMEGHVDDVWQRIANQLPLPNTCTCGTLQDNAIAIEWSGSVNVDTAIVIAMRTELATLPPPPEPPVADFSFDASHSLCDDSAVRFQDLSMDADGDIVSYAWDFGDASSSTMRSPQHTYAVAGTYLVTLTVTDATGGTDSKTRAVTAPGDVNCQPCLQPVAPRTVRAGDFVHFRVQADDLEHDALLFSLTAQPQGSVFEVGAGYFSWRPEPGAEGTYTIGVTVSDGFPHGGQATAECPVLREAILRVLPALAWGEAADEDKDGIDDRADNCPGVPNNGQLDSDLDQIGDACQEPAALEADPAAAPPLDAGLADRDHDGVADASDNCLDIANAAQRDMDRDGRGDVCDADLDGDGVAQVAKPGALLDNCPLVPNADQADAGATGVGDACRAPALRAPEAAAAPTRGAAAASAGTPAGNGVLVLAIVAIAFLAGMAALGLVLGATGRRPGDGGGRGPQ